MKKALETLADGAVAVVVTVAAGAIHLLGLLPNQHVLSLLHHGAAGTSITHAGILTSPLGEFFL